MTPTLPYPGMVFVPLDILTAEEQNQMVANDQYLRDFCAGLADGTNLSDDAVQAQKIDFSTFNRTTDLSSGYYEMGDLLFCWGRATVSVGTGSYAETQKAFTFPKVFASTPMVMKSCTDLGGYVGEYTAVSSVSTTSTTLVLGKVRNTDSAVSGFIQYLAVGVGS